MPQSEGAVKAEAKIYVVLFIVWIYFSRFFIDTLAWFPPFANWGDELLCVIGWGLVFVHAVERPRPPSILGKSVVVFTGVVLLSNLVAYNSLMFAGRYIVSFLKTVPIFYVIVYSELEVAELKKLGKFWVGACLAQVPMVYVQQREFFLTGAVTQDFDLGQGFLGLNAAHDVAELLVVVMFFHFSLVKSNLNVRKNLFIILACALALYLTFANHAYAEMAMAFFLLTPALWRRKITGKKILKYAAGFSLGFAVILWGTIATDSQVFEKFSGLIELDQIGKVQTWIELQNLLVGVKSFLLGLGPGTFCSAVALDLKAGTYYKEITSAILEFALSRGGSIVDIPFSTGISVFAETGIMGLLTFAWMYINGVLHVRRHRDLYEADTVLYAMFIAFNALAIIYAFLFFLTNFAENPALTLPFWLLLGCLTRYAQLKSAKGG